MALDNPLWRYALVLYACPGVEQDCLRLQDQGAAINRLLLACWLGQRGVTIEHEHWRALDNDWRREITEPLRQVRYRVRSRLSRQPEAEACYRALRQAELAAEQMELMLLWQTTRNWPIRPTAAGEACTLANLRGYRHMTGLPLEDALLRQLARAATDPSAGESELSSGPEY